MMAVGFVLCLLMTSSHAAMNGQDIAEMIQELKNKEKIAATRVRFVD